MEVDIVTCTVLLLGRLPFVLDDVRAALHPSLDINVPTGTSVEDVMAAFADCGGGVPVIAVGLVGAMLASSSLAWLEKAAAFEKISEPV